MHASSCLTEEQEQESNHNPRMTREENYRLQAYTAFTYIKNSAAILSMEAQP